MARASVSSILGLLSSGPRRRPAGTLPSALDTLFAALAASRTAEQAAAIEQRIWTLWMYHPHRRAAQHLDRAVTEIAQRRHDIAETRLTRLVRATPDYAEAWNKQATLFYLQERDAECLRTLHQVLLLEPRHFGAICAAAEVMLSSGLREEATFAFETALRVHPHLGEARQRLLSIH